MSILVHDSNKAACRAAAAALQQGCRAALVRPAGTGKGRIVWEMLAEQPDTRVLWVASCAARLELRRGLAKKLGKTLDGSVRLMDCEQLAAQSALGWVALAEFRPSLLVLDGWREMSARDWTDCVQLLFRLCPEAKVLALAEPDAPGESCRAAEELLGDAVVEPLTLGGALADGLLPMPTSYTALLWPQEAAMARLRAEVKNLRVPGTPDPNAEKYQALSLAVEQLPSVEVLLALSFGVGLFIFLIYKKTYQGVMYSSGFGVTLLALTMITTLVILAVTSNVVLSLGMVGALSIVRFRTAIKEPLDLAFLFWSIAAGIVLAAGFIPLAVIGSAIIGVILLLFVNRKSHVNPYILVLQCADSATEATAKAYLETKTQRCVLKSKAVQAGNIELNLELRLKSDNTDFINELSAMDGVTSAALVSYNGDYMG